MPSSPPENLTKISEDAAISSPMPSEIMAKTVPARLVEKLPKIRPNNNPGEAASERHQRQWHEKSPAAGHLDEMDREIAAKAEIDRMPE